MIHLGCQIYPKSPSPKVPQDPWGKTQGKQGKTTSVLSSWGWVGFFPRCLYTGFYNVYCICIHISVRKYVEINKKTYKYNMYTIYIYIERERDIDTRLYRFQVLIRKLCPFIFLLILPTGGRSKATAGGSLDLPTSKHPFFRGYIYIYLEPKWPLFWWKFGPCFGGLTLKNRGQVGF